MCRWLAYSGDALQISRVVLDTNHSLVAQSLNSPLGAETVNGDGFGLGWYASDGAPGDRPAVFHSIEPAWHDENLRELTNSIASPLFFGHVRAAGGPPIQQTNCHPFRYENWMFMHNGFLDGFTAMKRDLVLSIDESLFPLIHGTTDSEVLFYLALSLGLQDDPIGAMGKAVRRVEEVGKTKGIRFPMQGTLALSDGETLWAFRYSTARRSRSLYHSVAIPELREMYPDAARLEVFGDKAKVVVSEPLNDLPGAFVEVEQSTVAILTDDGYHHEAFLPGDDD